MNTTPLRKRLIIGISALMCLSTILLSHAESAREAVFKTIPSNSSLRYLYSDIEFSPPQDTTNSDCKALHLEFIQKFPSYIKQCLTTSYDITEYKSHAVLIKGNHKNESIAPNLLIYNHGHGGLPAETEHFAYTFIAGALESGNDVLLVSMPFLGVEKQYHPIMVKSWDGEVNYNPEDLEATPAAVHGVFELFDTGNSHYMRFFMDSAVVNALSLKKTYNKINFAGLSGGATTGLYACNVLKDLLSNCILAAGVMPLKYRFIKNNFGDSEQTSSNFFRKTNTIELIKEISRSKTKLTLIYNDRDACCYTKETANLFKQDIKSNNMKNINFIIRSSTNHDYDPYFMLNTINSN
ncbi:hypothetical protein PS858_02489 [Pseudomonas fluorescens]|uniref:hypothetical protein n=1 Tax=Pseudomonas fluorescens TaxID=294 RepID=UPI0012430A34|nr:hypothetical protein [Pseudomonas fluorescens]VVO94739.1 hypothetical protein PS858_02489 [Pseudomonas fluorescens]